ncbi:MAG: DUF4405 domain-containing protein [Thermoguttaceae bacterium]
MTRKIISLTLFFSFVFLVISSFVLYFMPEGRVAYWGNWMYFGFTKPQWSALHITGGFLFVIVGIWHTVLNWKVILFYLKKTVEKNIKAPIPIFAAFCITFFVYAGTILQVQPMKQIMVWNSLIKKNMAQKYGDPPYGHAELSTLDQFCSFLKLDVETVLDHLKERKLNGVIDQKTVILDLATENSLTPQQLYVIIRQGVSQGNPFAVLPPTPPPGTGKMTLQELCGNYQLPIEEVIIRLKTHGIDAAPDESLRDIAQKHSKTPHDVYLLLCETPQAANENEQ